MPENTHAVSTFIIRYKFDLFCYICKEIKDLGSMLLQENDQQQGEVIS